MIYPPSIQLPSMAMYFLLRQGAALRLPPAAGRRSGRWKSRTCRASGHHVAIIAKLSPPLPPTPPVVPPPPPPPPQPYAPLPPAPPIPFWPPPPEPPENRSLLGKVTPAPPLTPAAPPLIVGIMPM